MVIHFVSNKINLNWIQDNDLEEIRYENGKLINEFKYLQEENVDLLIQIKHASTKLYLYLRWINY